MSADPSQKRSMRETWSRTALVGAYAVGGVTLLGVAGILSGRLAADIVRRGGAVERRGGGGGGGETTSGRGGDGADGVVVVITYLST